MDFKTPKPGRVHGLPTNEKGIFDNLPINTGMIHLNSSNPTIQKILKELNLIEITKPNLKKFAKRKTVNFRDFLTEVIDHNNDFHSTVIYVKVVEELLQVKIND